jgi:hypothetical protein
MEIVKILNKKTDTIIKGAVNVARPSLFGNPFKIGPHGSRGQVLVQYKTYFENRVKSDPTFREQLRKIMNATALVCYCAPLPCHADILKDYLMGLKAKAFMDSCPDSVSIGECWEENKNNGGGFTVQWSVAGVGFGSFTFCIKKDKIVCDNETMGKPFIKKIFERLVDTAEMKDPHPEDVNPTKKPRNALYYENAVFEKAEKLKDGKIAIQEFEEASIIRDIHNLAKKAISRLEKKGEAEAK